MKEKPLPDPLLTSKKPIEGRSYPVEASVASRDEIPPPPPVPSLPGDGSRQADSSVVHLLGVRPVR